MDPSLLLAHEHGDPFEQETVVFGLFLINPYKTREQKLTKLKELAKYLEFELTPWIDHYPWYLEPIQWELHEEYEGKCFISGKLVYGECIQDLWLLSSILFKFTSRDNELYIRIFDQEGEFLLVETAPTLPAWLQESTNGTNRVWINQQMIKVVPEQYRSGTSISMDESLGYLNKWYFRLEPLAGATEKLSDKLTKYPEEVLKLVYEEKVHVSAKLAQFIGSHKDYYCNAAINHELTSMGPRRVDGPFDSDYYGEDVEVTIWVSVLAHMLMKDSDNELLPDALNKFTVEFKGDGEVDPGEAVVRTNASDGANPLQEELIKRMIINRPVASEEPQFPSEDPQVPTETTEMDLGAVLGGLKEQLEAEGPSEPAIESSINLDDFFEFFCKEALHLNPSQIEQMRNSDDG